MRAYECVGSCVGVCEWRSGCVGVVGVQMGCEESEESVHVCV